MQNISNKIRENISIVALVVVFFVLGITLGYHNAPAIDKVTLANKNTQVTTTADFTPFWQVWNTLNDTSLNGSKVSDQDKVYGAIAGLVGSLNDPYSVFFKPDEAKSFEDQIAGNFTGVGMEVGIKDNLLTVIAPLKDTPAFNAGIKSGDIILKIDSTNTSGLTIDDAIKLMRGDKGTTVTLTVLHQGAKNPTEIKIVRDVIETPTLDTKVLPNGVFVISLYSFDANSAALFRNAITQFAHSDNNKLILDLRGNPGGYLDSAVDISSWFLPAGKVVVTEDYGGKQPSDILRSRGYDLLSNKKFKFAILIDGGSASASEIVSGAMQDQGVAKLVGTQSFGKGSVQTTEKVTPDTLLKVTIARWLTPNGTSISLKGLTPDYVVPITQKEVDVKKDPQMDKAIQILSN